jgi:FkbM family methyltransferase
VHSIRIGSIQLELPEGHGLSEIYQNNPQYQKNPWAVIAKYASRIPRDNLLLLDLGCNIGDSIAHFKVHSNAEIIAVEASKKFYDLAVSNCQAVNERITFVNALIVDDVDSTYQFVEGAQTAHISKTGSDGIPYDGQKITVNQLLEEIHEKVVIYKSDLDGFDTRILKSFFKTRISLSPEKFPIIFIEGPTEFEMRKLRWFPTFNLLLNLISKNYEIILFSNRGEIVQTLTKSKLLIFVKMLELTFGLIRNRAFAHYLDFVAIHKSLI